MLRVGSNKLSNCHELKERFSLTAILDATGILRLISGMLRTFLEDAAYCSVESVSSRLMEAGDTVAMIDVFVFPPRESCSSRVSFDSLQERNGNNSVKAG